MQVTIPVVETPHGSSKMCIGFKLVLIRRQKDPNRWSHRDEMTCKYRCNRSRRLVRFKSFHLPKMASSAHVSKHANADACNSNRNRVTSRRFQGQKSSNDDAETVVAMRKSIGRHTS